jgi:Family of unknown function (DUF5716)
LLGEAATTSDVLEVGLDRYRQAVLGNYHRLKTVDNLYKWRGEILHRLAQIESSELLLAQAARWFAEQIPADLETASRVVTEHVRLLRAHFDTLPELIDDIDARNARFSGVALRKIMYLLRHDQRIEGQLQFLVDRLIPDDTPDIEFDVYKCELLGDDFLYTPPRRLPKVGSQPLDRKPASDPEKLRRVLASRLHRAFSRSRVEAYVDTLLGARHAAPLSEAAPDSDEAYVRLIFTVVYGVDGRSTYRFESNGGPAGNVLDQKGVYGFPQGLLRRKKKRTRG